MKTDIHALSQLGCQPFGQMCSSAGGELGSWKVTGRQEGNWQSERELGGCRGTEKLARNLEAGKPERNSVALRTILKPL